MRVTQQKRHDGQHLFDTLKAGKNYVFSFSFLIEMIFRQKMMPDKTAVMPLVNIKGVS